MTRSENRRKLWKKRELENKCIYCGLKEPVQNKKGCSDCLSEKVKKTIEFSKKNKEKSAQYRLSIKHIVINKYGGRCSCCNESEILFLTIDHKNNNGKSERHGIKNYNTYSYYLNLKKEPLRNDLQVLCFNCNLGKSLNNGVCPHEKINRVLLTPTDNRRSKKLNLNTKIDWPEDDILIDMCNEKSVAQTAKDLGVDFSTISGRLKRRNKYHLVKKRQVKLK